jgi:hypothetical protein
LSVSSFLQLLRRLDAERLAEALAARSEERPALVEPQLFPTVLVASSPNTSGK